MTRWPRSETWSLRRGGSRRPLCLGARVPALLLLFVLAVGGGPAQALVMAPDRPMRLEASDSGPRTVIITIPGASWRELRSADMPSLHRLMERGAVGLMPVPSASDADPDRTWVTLGAGRAAAGGKIGPPMLWGEGGIQVDLSALLASNQAAHTSAEPGALGELLHFVGCPTFVISLGRRASGTPTYPALAVVMDKQGKVDGGRLGDALAPASPDDAEPPRHALKEALLDGLLHYRVVVLDLEGAAEADASDRPRSHSDLTRTKARALRAADNIIGDAVAAFDGYEVLLFVLSPSPPSYTSAKQRALCPVILCQLGEEDTSSIAPENADNRRLPWAGSRWDVEQTPGLLTSASTRWPGLVTAADLAPSILSWWGIEPTPGLEWDVEEVFEDAFGTMRGRRLEIVPASGHLARLDTLDRTLAQRYRLRFTTGKWYLAYGGLLLLSSLAFGLWWPQGLRLLGAGALGAALAPVGMLLAPVVGLERAGLHLLAAAAITAAVALTCARAKRPAAGLAAAMLLGSAPIVLDVLLGSPLMRRSTFGFGETSGARFYGIGNEYMGFLAAMSVIGLGALLQTAPHTRWAAALAGALVVVVIGAPWWGANWGGAFAAAAGLIALWLTWRRKRWGASVLLAIVLLAASALIPVALDALRPAAERTHIGANAAAVLAGDVGMFADAVRRKAAMNWGLLATFWPGLLPGAVVVAALAWRLLAAGRPARRALAAQPALAAGIFGALVAALVAMVVNDSGVIAAAAALGIGAGALVFVAARPLEAPA